MKLYELAQMMDMVINGGLVFDEETGEVLFDSSNLDELEAALDAKIEACCIVVKETEAEAEAIKAEEKRLKARRERKEKEAARLREYVQRCMEQSGARKIDTPRVCVTSRSSKYVNVYDEAKVPRMFMAEKITESVDKKAVREAIKDGIEVPGCELSERISLKIE